MENKAAINLYDLQTRLATSDQSALKLLYDHLFAKLFYFSYSIVHTKEVSEEIIEDVFMQVWKQRERIMEIENLTHYMYVAVKNTAYSYLRKNNKENSFTLDEVSLPYLKIDLNPELIMISNETIQRINLAINNLPPKCRHIFKLVKEDGLKYKEVAELLDISIKTVENQLGIALKKIQSSISAQLHEKIRVSEK